MQYLNRKEANMNRFNLVVSSVVGTMKLFLSMLFGTLLHQVSPHLAVL